MNRTHRGLKNSGPSPGPSWPLPRPLPQREGSNHRDTPIKKVVGFVMSLNGGLVGVTSHITPLPAGEGLGEGPLSYGFETVRKNVLLNL